MEAIFLYSLQVEQVIGPRPHKQVLDALPI